MNTTRSLVRLEGLDELKKSFSSQGLEPETFRRVSSALTTTLPHVLGYVS
jgi:hypothetical protein